MESSGKADGAGSGAKSPVVETGKMQPEKGNGVRIGGYVMTWLLSVASAALMGWAWITTHPRADMMAVVDLNAVLSDEIAKLDREVKPDMTEEKKLELARRAMETTKRVDEAIKQLASECKCTVVSAAAVIANGSSNVRDMTWRAKELVTR